MSRRIGRRVGAVLAASILVAAGWWQFGPQEPANWTEADLAVLQSLSLDSLPPLAPDPSNAVADDPQAAEFGHRLFFDTRLSANGEISCASCHRPELGFTDGLQKGKGIGRSKRNTRGIAGALAEARGLLDPDRAAVAERPERGAAGKGLVRHRIMDHPELDPARAGHADGDAPAGAGSLVSESGIPG